jgi:hypothetical protein
MAGNQDLFAPPSTAEIAQFKKTQSDIFAPPSEAEITAIKKEIPDALTSAKVKFQEGALLGFRPFVAGLGGAAGAGVGSLDTSTCLPLAERLSQAGSAAKEAFLDARSEATTEQDRAQKAHPYLSTASNLGGSLLTLPLIPAKGIAGAMKVGGITGLGNAASTATDLKGAVTDIGTGVGLGAGAYGAGKLVGAGARKVGETRLGQEVKELGSVLLDLPRKAGIKLSNVLTGVPEKEIQTYATQTEKVNKMISESGGDITAAADAARQKIQAGIQSTKTKLNSQISKAIEAAPVEQSIPVEPILNKLHSFKAKLNTNTQAEAISQIDDMIGVVTREAETNADGLVNLKSLQDIKNFLQEKGKQAFLKGGQIFSTAKEAQVAAKQASTEALKILNPLAPEIAAANKQLSHLHFIENNMNRNLIASGKPEAALIAAGSGVNPRNAAVLRRLGEMTGQDALGEAERLAAAKRFGNPSFSPVDVTGKSLMRMATGAAIGYAVDGKEGAFLGGALTSPAALKAAINVGQIPLGVITNLIGKGKAINDKTIGRLYDFLKTDQGKGALIQLMNNRVEYGGAPGRRIASESNSVDRRVQSR